MHKDILQVLGTKQSRSIGVAVKRFENVRNARKSSESESALLDKDVPLDTYLVEKDFVFMGVFGIQDPIRKDVPHAIALCETAGVQVRMVTGDNTLIATSIAKECNILPKDFKKEDDEFAVMEGTKFWEMCGGLEEIPENAEKENQDEEDKLKNNKGKITYKVRRQPTFQKIAPRLKVMARSLPEHKLLLVTGLQEMGKVVAVTGDGTNDAPALKKSNVGFAMGKMGTDVCKDASKIILLDDSFSSIVTAIKYGRNVFDAIRKFVQFQLTVNIVAMACAITGGLLIDESPINAIQMLWLNMIMDSFAALALATDPPSEELLTRKPIGKHERIITDFMWKTILFQSLCQYIFLMAFLFLAPSIFDIKFSQRTGKEYGEWNFEKGMHLT